MESAPNSPSLQTPAQWAVRWHAVVLVALLIAAVPVVHVVWHVGLGATTPLLPTRSQVPAPVATSAAVLDGSWMLEKEKQLREDSPITWWLRGSWNELKYRAGVPQSPLVHFGRNEWFFIKESVLPDRAAWDRATPKRRQFLRDVKSMVEKAGAELFLAIVPDKARVYPERCYPDGQLPACKSSNYAAMLAELGELGIPTADLAAAMAQARGEMDAARAADPQGDPAKYDLYFARDTHWRPQGALAGGRAMALALEARFGSKLSARVPMELGALTEVRLLGDLSANLGLATIEVPDQQMERRTVALSLLSERLGEVRGYYGVNQRTPNGTVAMDGTDPNAEVLVIGTSFSEENGRSALSLFLGRPVRSVIVRGAAGMKPLRAALDELQQGTRAKVVVWEMVERGQFEAVWLEPKL